MVVDVPMFVAGDWRDSDDTMVVVDPYRSTDSSRVHRPGSRDAEDALATAVEGAGHMAAMPGHRRAEILDAVADAVADDPDRFATQIVHDCGKTIRDARGEVARAIEVLHVSAGEATRIEGTVLPLDALPAGEGSRLGMVMRFPVGVVAAIVPFNAPLQVLCHKVGPALAVGNAVVCLAPRQGAAVAADLLRLLLDAGLPPEAFQLLPAGGETVGDQLVAHPRIDMIAFTGSGRTGEHIIRTAGLKRTLLELSGNAAVIVHEDANLDIALSACVPAAYGIAGQSCVSLQRLYVHRSLFDETAERLAGATAALRTGDTMSEDTDVGVMIGLDAATRVGKWIAEAVDGGATVLTGGRQDGTTVEPTVLSSVSDDMKVVCDEVFGPVVSILPYDDVDDALRRVNGSRWGLAAGIYTRSLDVAMRAAKQIRAGVVNINGPSRYRVEHMPFGGVKASGWGKEGPRYSIADMTEVRTITFTPAEPAL